MSSSGTRKITVVRLCTDSTKTQKLPTLTIFKTPRGTLDTNMPSCEMSEIMMAAQQRLAAAKAQESSALQAVVSQRAMLQMMKRNMTIAQSKLESTRQAVKEAENHLRTAEKRRGSDTSMPNVDSGIYSGLKCKRMDAVAQHSPTQMQVHPSVNNQDINQTPRAPFPSDNQAQQHQRTPSSQQLLREPQLKEQLLNLTPEAKMILREVVMSAVLDPHGKVDPIMLGHATKKVGLSEQAVLNAVQVARIRLRRKRKSTSGEEERVECTSTNGMRGKINTGRSCSKFGRCVTGRTMGSSPSRCSSENSSTARRRGFKDLMFADLSLS